MAGHGDVTNNWDEFSKLAWSDSYWAGNEEARDALKAAVDAAVFHLSEPEAKTAKAKKLLGGIASGLGIVKGIFGF